MPGWRMGVAVRRFIMDRIILVYTEPQDDCVASGMDMQYTPQDTCNKLHKWQPSRSDVAQWPSAWRACAWPRDTADGETN